MNFEVGLQFANEFGIHEFIIEGDSLVLGNDLQELSPPPSSVFAVVYGLRDVIHEFRQVDISHVHRQVINGSFTTITCFKHN